MHNGKKLRRKMLQETVEFLEQHLPAGPQATESGGLFPDFRALQTGARRELAFDTAGTGTDRCEVLEAASRN